MSRHATEIGKRSAASPSLLELRLHGGSDELEFREVGVVETKATNEFPDLFDQVKVGTVGRQDWAGGQLHLRRCQPADFF